MLDVLMVHREESFSGEGSLILLTYVPLHVLMGCCLYGGQEGGLRTDMFRLPR